MLFILKQTFQKAVRSLLAKIDSKKSVYNLSLFSLYPASSFLKRISA